MLEEQVNELFQKLKLRAKNAIIFGHQKRNRVLPIQRMLLKDELEIILQNGKIQMKIPKSKAVSP